MIPAELPLADIKRCAVDPRFVADVTALYAQLDERIAARQPVCINRGACCQFATFDHHLFVTSVELAFFLAHCTDGLLAPPDRSFCPYQQQGRCTARDARPSGCRIFFCQGPSQHWQPDETEWALDRMGEIGARYELPYAYVEWTDALRQLGGTPTPNASERTLLIQIDTQSVHT